MTMNKMLNLVNQRIALNSVEFQRFEKAPTNSNIIVEDEICDLSVKGTSISMVFKRRAFFKPDSLFSVSVSFIYCGDISEESLADLEKEEKVFDLSFVSPLAEKIINGTTIPAHASLLISQCTALNGAAPLVTPPAFIKNK